jgi:NADPH-dependent ferric siderophore reductase
VTTTTDSRTELRTRLTEVVAVTEVAPRLVEVTFRGGGLDDFMPVGPDTFLYLLLPPPGRPELTIDESFGWEGYERMPESERPVGAYYTLRRWRPELAELDIWMVLHDDPGPAAGWAERARPGEVVALWGPRTAYAPPADTEWFLLAADETGLPAVAAILESLDPSVPVRVVAEVADEVAHQPLPARDSVEVTWLHRGAGHDAPSRLAAAVRELDWPHGNPYVWGGAESRAMTAVRRHVRDERGLPQDRVSLVAYWRHAG